MTDTTPYRTIALVAHWDWVLYNFRLPLALRLSEAGFDVTFVCPEGKYVRVLVEAGFRWIDWPVSRRSVNPLKEVGSIIRLIRIYRRHGFNICHHFTIKPNLYGTIASRFNRKMAVINTFSGMGYVFSGAAKAGLIRALVLPPMKWALSRRGVYTTFQNPSDLEAAVGSKLLPRERARLIVGSGVDVERFRPVSKSKDAPVVVMAARLLRDKGVIEFLKAAQMLIEGGSDARFVLAGEPDIGSPSSLTETELEMWRKHGSVEFTGHVADVVPLLRSADIAVLPTYYPEGVPKFLIEAAACGLALVASDIPPCREVVQEGRNGYLVPIKDARALAAALKVLTEDSDLRTEMGRTSRRLVEDRFDERDVLLKHIQLYEEALAAS